METAKNLILAGPGLVSLCDDEPVAMPDLGANFFLGEGDVGKPRARYARSVCRAKATAVAVPGRYVVCCARPPPQSYCSTWRSSSSSGGLELRSGNPALQRRIL